MGELNEEYAEFFSEFDRVSSRRAKKVQVVLGERLGEFIFKLSNDPAIDIEAAALVITLVSGGLRISEALRLKKCDFVADGGMLLAKAFVLKKGFLKGEHRGVVGRPKKPERKTVLREFRIHPSGESLLRELLSKRKPHEFVFRVSRFKAFRIMKVVFGNIEGIDNHCFRHSHVSYLLENKNLNHLKIALLLKMSVNVVELYSHQIHSPEAPGFSRGVHDINSRRELSKLF